jgi:tRNA A-37 threonylcarbamoyl transferase component Bud32
MTDTHVEPELSQSLARSLSSTALFLKRQLWIWPLAAAVLLVIIGFWVRARVDRAIQEKLAAELETILNADVAGLEIWLEAQKSNASAAARSADIQRLVAELLAAAENPGVTTADLAADPSGREIAVELAPWLEEHGYSGFVVADVDQRILASHSLELLGKESLPGYSEFLPKVLSGSPTVSHPFPSIILLTDKTGRMSAGLPTMYAAAPVRDADGRIIAALGLRLQPDVDFTRILSVARGGKTGETYAFNRQGLLLSESRFDEQLKRVGLIADFPESRSILQLEVRDPGIDLTTGARPAKSRSEMPLTSSVASATAGNSGVDVVGYRDYRGVPVVAAWTWLPDYDFGVVTEIDRSEAHAPLYVVRPIFWGLVALLAVSALAIFIFSLFVSKLRHRVRHEALKARRLGQYTLEAKIGQGAMGVVYRGNHAMLRRPTAIKLLSAEKITEISIARFEREVRLTSQLNHPNTIAVYDFGRTPEGVFYYAMELLEGINLDTLVRASGPVPEGRAIYLLSQMCGSLGEAHSLGLIHRDVKPANIMVCQRGGMYDVIKLLDFGLVKAVDADSEMALTSTNVITGTPLYLAPEAITAPESVDLRSDLYSLGAVAYFLLTGTTVFTGASLMDICRKHVDLAPEPLSQRLGRRIDPDLEALVLRCLAKRPSDRFASAEELAGALAACASAGTWTRAAARQWWDGRAANETASDGSGPATVERHYEATVISATSPSGERL